jgi:hypothetical protein
MLQSAPTIAQTAPVPKTAQELQALRVRRAELREQLESVTSWRGRLVQERLNAQAAGNPGVAGELDGRIRELGDRSKRIEQALLSTDDAIGQGIANGIADEGHTVVIPPIPPIPEMPGFPGAVGIHEPPFFTGRDIAVVVLGQTLGFVLIGLFLWRVAFRRGVRSVQPVSGGRDVNQLQQSVDAIAVEIERISENQRFVTKLLNENGQKVPEQAGAASKPR